MTVTYEIGHEGKKLKHKRDKSDDVILVIEDDSDSRGESRFIFEREREHKHKHRSSHGHKSKHKSSPVVSDAESEYGSDNPPDIKSAPESALDPKWYNPAPRRAERSRVKFESRRTDRGVIDAVDMLEANFPGGKKLTPDRYWSERDCRALSALEAKHRANKWLTIQAEFANYTGRMVDANVLKAKFVLN
ncbi:hypothetical protein GGS26DRAFT_115285 [Hypomontagnella submonticulosa]|nr:hypothetical protein GGS26DRAFT_115285 [Hypomontagnella submonticulosa]